MKKNLHWLLIFLFFIGTSSVLSQTKNEPQKSLYVGKPDKVEKIPSIASRKELALFKNKGGEMKDGRASKHDIIPGKGSTGDDLLAKNPHRLKNTIKSSPPSLVFETAASGSYPTDPSGAVGPNHYIAVTNTAFRIFDKSGNPLTPLVAPYPTIFPSGGCCDLTASYDSAADRWVLTFLGGGVQIAVSDGPDPVNDGWTTYKYGLVKDYQKLSVWSDGYYMTENTPSAEKLHVFDRDAMLNGDADAAIQSFALPGLVIGGFHSAQALNVTNNNYPPAGNATIVYMQDDAWSGVSNDHIKVWTVNIDWETPANSTISAALELGNADGVTNFTSTFDGGSFANLSQPEGGQAIDALQSTMMNQAQYRKFPTYNSALFNFVVDSDGSPGERAAVRWYELRQSDDGEPWTVHQEGTYTSPDGKHAWNASMAMDGQGNIGMGYTAMSGPTTPTTKYVGSYYTGRLANDPLGTMTIMEEIIQEGDENIPSFDRYGDYSKIDVDPSNDKEFWYVNELMSNGRKNIAGVFQIAPKFANDIGVITIDSPISGILNNAEVVSVTLFNFGSDSASGFNVSYEVNGVEIASQVYTGTLAPSTSDIFTFTTTADLSVIGDYTIVAKTNLNGDQNLDNDPITAVVSNILANDVGVIALTAPSSAEGLGNEAITVTLKNFGGQPQSNFNVSYVLDDVAIPTPETFTGTLNPNETDSFTFSTLGNFSNKGDHEVVARTLSSGDGNATNDSFTATIVNFNCSTKTNSTSQPVGPNSGEVTSSVINITDNFLVKDVNVTLNIDHTFIKDMSIKLIGPDGTEVTLLASVGGNGNGFIKTVLDDDAEIKIENGSFPFTGSFIPQTPLAALNGLMSAGDWTLEITDNTDVDGGNLNNWSLNLCSDSVLSVDDNVLVNDGFTVISQYNNQFLVKLETSSIQERLSLFVYNTLGQKLSWKTLENETGNGYEHTVDMSHVQAGVYFVRIGNSTAGNTKRIIVR